MVGLEGNTHHLTYMFILIKKNGGLYICTFKFYHKNCDILKFENILFSK